MLEGCWRPAPRPPGFIALSHQQVLPNGLAGFERTETGMAAEGSRCAGRSPAQRGSENLPTAVSACSQLVRMGISWQVELNRPGKGSRYFPAVCPLAHVPVERRCSRTVHQWPCGPARIHRALPETVLAECPARRSSGPLRVPWAYRRGRPESET